jgi:hypothetical protein
MRVGVLGEGEGRALRRPGRRRDTEVERVQRRRCADVDGFSLHADVCVPARDRAQLERLCRYVARPAIASERLELLADCRVRYNFKRTWRDGSVAVEFDPIDFVGQLAALVPRPRANLVRYHGCLAPHASLRAYVVKDRRGPPPTKAEVSSMAATRMAALRVGSSAANSCAPPRERGLRWAELMHRVSALDVLLYPSCAGRMKAIAEITDRRVAQTMLEHVGVPSDAPEPCPARGPAPSVGASRSLDHEPQADEPPPDIEWSPRSTATGACVQRLSGRPRPLRSRERLGGHRGRTARPPLDRREPVSCKVPKPLCCLSASSAGPSPTANRHEPLPRSRGHRLGVAIPQTSEQPPDESKTAHPANGTGSGRSAAVETVW